MSTVKFDYTALDNAIVKAVGEGKVTLGALIGACRTEIDVARAAVEGVRSNLTDQRMVDKRMQNLRKRNVIVYREKKWSVVGQAAT